MAKIHEHYRHGPASVSFVDNAWMEIDDGDRRDLFAAISFDSIFKSFSSSLPILAPLPSRYPLPKMPPEYYHQQPGSLSAPSEANIATRNDAGKVMSDTSVQQQQQQPGKSQPEAPTQSQVPVIAPGAISSEQPQAKRLRKN